MSSSSSPSPIPDWALLPKHLLDSIVDRIVKFSDYVRICSVCKPWRLAALEETTPYHHGHKQNFQILKTCRNQLPLLMILTKNKHNSGFYSVPEGVLHDVKLPGRRSISCSYINQRCLGTAHGWFLTVEKPNVVILVNPFTSRTIHLPKLKDPDREYVAWIEAEDDTSDYFIVKGIISCDPYLNPDSYEVAVTYGGMSYLACFKSGTGNWTCIDLRNFVCSDLIYYEGRLHAVNAGVVVTLVRIDDVITGSHSVVVKQDMGSSVLSTNYLVEALGGDLLLVERFIDSTGGDDNEPFTFKTITFRVHKLTDSGWHPIKNLEGQALFLGYNYSMSISTAEVLGLKSNCIYYTDHCHVLHPNITVGAADDAGVYSLEDESFSLHYVRDASQPFKHLLPAVWIVPNFKGT